MIGVGTDALGSALRIVRRLFRHVDRCAGHAPVAVTAGPALLVEVEILVIAWIARIAGPDLQAGVWVARKYSDVTGGGRCRYYPVGPVQRASLRSTGRRRLVGALIGRSAASRALHQMGIDEEELESGLSQCRIDADACEGRRMLPCRFYGVGPLPIGPVSALRYPDTARRFSQMPRMGGDSGL